MPNLFSSRITTVGGKKYLLQHPVYNNCLVVALFNALLDDNQDLDLDALSREEKRLNAKYDIDNRGLQATMIGDIAWKHGYTSMLLVSPGPEITYPRDRMREGWKMIRVFGWVDGDCFMTEHEITQAKAYKEIMSHDTGVKKKIRKTVTGFSGFSGIGGLGAHAVFIKDLRADEKFLGINFAIGVNVKYTRSWFDIGVCSEEQRKGRAMGSEMCLCVKKLHP